MPRAACARPQPGLILAALLVSAVALFVVHKLAQGDSDSLIASFLYFGAAFQLSAGTGRRWLSWLGLFSAASGGSGFVPLGLLCVYPTSSEQQVTLAMLSPFLFIAALWVNAFTHKLVTMTATGSRLLPIFDVGAYLRTTAQLLVAGCSMVAQTAFDVLQCVNVHNGFYVVFQHPSILSPSAVSVRALSYALIVAFVVGLPLLVLIVLFVGWRRELLVDPNFALVFSGLYASYRPTCFWYKIVDILRRTSTVVLGFTFHQVCLRVL